MSQTQQQPAAEPESRPGKIRTWWHPLLANMLRWQLGSHYEVQEEVPVGKKPLQIDLLLLHREQGELPAKVRQSLAGLVEYLGEFTLVEFKSPSDTLRVGDCQTLLSNALLDRAQNDPLLAPDRLHLLVLAPRLTKPFREELRVLGVIAQQQGAGVWSLEGGLVMHPTWVLETEELAGLSHPLLTLFSPGSCGMPQGPTRLCRRGVILKWSRTSPSRFTCSAGLERNLPCSTSTAKN
jgi:hypothetical protein